MIRLRKPECETLRSGIMEGDKMRIYLASASPRRKELLKQVGISFKTMPSEVVEKITKTEPNEVVEELSYQKAVDICGKLSA